MQNQWPTQSKDMSDATNIAKKYFELNESEPLGFLEIVIDAKKSKLIGLRIPDWIKEIMHHFRENYGDEQGPLITAKVLTRFLIRNETIH